ncbi:hypothetical protein [Variovorax sp. KBW07]|uniref:hypothetical protein n=1 Tax=Variovorax sp. KBW07 TaxID=2153358 RepID=UPI000F585261|nr:hypothetical protein [Variovorax sp. KBW07]
MKRFASRECCSRFSPLSSRQHFLARAILWPLLGIGLGIALVPQARASDGPQIAQAPAAAAPRAAVVQDRQRAAETDLGVTPEEFRQRFNTLIDLLDKNWRLAELEVESGSNENVFNRKLDGISIIGGVSKQTGRVLSLHFAVELGREANTDFAYAVLFVSARAVTKGATTQALGDAITVVMAEAVGRLDQTPMESVTRTVGNRTVSGLASTAAGLLISVYPTE